jgi:serine protease
MRSHCGVLLLLSSCTAQLGDPAEEVGRNDAPTWEEFMASVHHEPFEDGVWIVDGDVPIDSEKRLVDYYESLLAENGLTVATYGGRDSIWSATQRRNLTYCVSTSFGTRHAAVVAAMESAGDAWEAIADVDFRYVAAEDGRCTASNANVLFDVRPTSGGSYLARAFFPYQSRGSRNVLIDSTSFNVRAPLTLAGVIRHELGHALGFRHEHTRSTSNSCYEDSQWRGVTEYDRGSVMHYPQCGGTNSALTISATDARGAASLYGAPSGTAPMPVPVGTPASGGIDGTLAAGAEQAYEPLPVVPGTTVRIAISGTGDADLYVRFGSAPTLTAYDCRPYRGDAAEVCELTVPAGVSRAHFMVHGYTATTYHLDASWTQP